MFLKLFNKLEGHVLSGLRPLGFASWLCTPIKHSHSFIKHFLWQIKLAGLQAFLHQIKPKDQSCTSFRAKAKILLTDEVLENPSGLVKFVIPFCNRNGDYLGEVTEKDTEYNEKHRVYHRK